MHLKRLQNAGYSRLPILEMKRDTERRAHRAHKLARLLTSLTLHFRNTSDEPLSDSQMAGRHLDRQLLTILEDVHLFQLSAFVSICRSLLPVIHETWRKHKLSGPLPLNVLAYLCGYLKMEVEQVDLCWEVLRSTIESNEIPSFQHLIAGPESNVESVCRLYSLNVRE